MTNIFNPDISQSSVDFTRESQGSQADTSVGQALKATGDLVSATTKFATNEVTDAISREAELSAEFQTDAVLDQGVPSELKRSLRQQGVMKKSKDKGNLSEEHYWSRLTADAKRLRARYPGFKDHIDREFSRLTGSIPANKLRQMEFARQRKEASSGSDITRRIQQRATTLNYPGDVFGTSNDELRTWIADEQTRLNSMNHNRLRFEQFKRNDQVNEINSTNMAREDMVSTYKGVMNSGPAGASVQRFLTMTPEEIKGLTPDQISQTTIAFNQMINLVQRELNNSTTRYASSMKTQEIEAQKESLLQPLVMMRDALRSKEFDAVKSLQDTVKFSVTSRQQDLMENVKGLETLAATSQLLGGQVATEVIGKHTDSYRDITSELGKQMLEEGKLKKANGTTSVSSNMQNLKNRGEATPRTMRSELDVTLATIADKKMDPRVRINNSIALVSDNDASFLTHIAEKDRVLAIGKVLSPELIASVSELSKQQPRVGELFKKWAGKSLGAAGIVSINRIRNSAKRLNTKLVVGEDGLVSLRKFEGAEQGFLESLNEDVDKVNRLLIAGDAVNPLLNEDKSVTRRAILNSWGLKEEDTTVDFLMEKAAGSSLKSRLEIYLEGVSSEAEEIF